MPTILLAIDACTQLERLLPAALLLASQQHLELLGMFVQDSRLLHGVALPFMHEVGANSATCYPLSAASLSSRVQRIADDMRRRLASAAVQQQLPYEFQMCHGSITQITSESQADFVISGWSSDLSVTIKHLRLPTKHSLTKPVIAVVDDGTQSPTHVMEAARRLTASTGTHQLVVLAMVTSGGQPRNEPVTMPLRHSGEIVIPIASMEQLIRQIRVLRPTVMLLGRVQTLATDRQLHRQLALLKCPLALAQSTW